MDTLLTLVFSLLTVLTQISNAQFTSSRNFYPPAYPLAVRSPYLNAWIRSPTRNTASLGDLWALHWDDRNIMGIAGYARVDGIPYRWMAANSLGNPNTLVSTEITPTRSKFTISVGAVQLNVTFLSPIEPSDWVLQSLPFIYVSVDVSSRDGLPHSVQVYLDTTAEWLSGDRTNRTQWKTTDSDIAIHEATLSQPFKSEINNVAGDSTLYFGMVSSSNSSWQTGADLDVRNQFLSRGTLRKTQDTQFRAINDRFVVFAHAFDFGNITRSSTPAVWSLGLIRDPVITYSTGAGAESRSPYYRAHYENVEDAVKSFIRGYGEAVKRADILDAKIMTDASAVSNKYADLVAMGARQTMAIDITVARGTDGKWNMSDVKAFMKDTGTSQSINSVEGLFSAFPAFLYLNSSLGGLLLDPLLEFQSSSTERRFSAPDLGSYPQATGHQSSFSNVAVESTGNMLIMALAHAQASGDGTLVARYYDLLKGWTNYLSASSLHTENQLSADGMVKNDQSNLAIKGIIGIAAMAKISQALGQESDSKMYSAKASELSAQWTTLAASGGNIASFYNQPQTRPLVYNLYADILLRTSVVNSSIYSQQTKLYETLTANAPAFGIPFDDSTQATQGLVSAPWTVFTAATATQNTTRDKLIDMVHSKASSNGTGGDFPTTYRASSGEVFVNYGQASPAQGGMFAILALSLPVQTIAVPSNLFPGVVPGVAPDAVSSATKSNGGAIAGAVIGTLAGVGVLALGFLLWRRQRKNILQQDSLKPIPFNSDLLFSQRVPDDVTTSPISQAHLRPRLRVVLPDDGRSHFSSPSTVSEPSTTNQQLSQSVLTRSLSTTKSDWGTMVQSPDASTHLRHEIAALRQQMSELHQEVSGSLSPVREPSTRSVDRSSTLPGAHASQLRNELAALREQVNDLQVNQELVYLTPPPEYDTEHSMT
ncbi:hypothetical protein L218DRAFT_1004158 [Marasmius fiardii PR-910]|nr:hypothetical protein L218DRAFT_1004158 [Marasmius fiardii PR-910]